MDAMTTSEFWFGFALGGWVSILVCSFVFWLAVRHVRKSYDTIDEMFSDDHRLPSILRKQGE